MAKTNSGKARVSHGTAKAVDNHTEPKRGDTPANDANTGNGTKSPDNGGFPTSLTPGARTGSRGRDKSNPANLSGWVAPTSTQDGTGY